MQEERILMKNILDEVGYGDLETHIFKYCYDEAIKREIILDWDGLFKDWYFINVHRIVSNIKLFPEVFKNLKYEEIMQKKDSDFNVEYKKYNIEVKRRQREINTDYTCKKCKNIGVYVDKIQKRSLDEGKTNVFECSKCHYTWYEN